MKTSDMLVLGAVAVGGYMLFKAWGEASSAIASATKAPVTAAAQAYVNLTSGPAMTPQGSILLPEGSAIPVSAVNVTPVAGSNSATFNYLGQQYFLNAPSDPATGNWSADTFMVQ